MKRKLTYLLSLLLLMLFVVGCIKPPPADDGTTQPLPEGLFGGTFTVIHFNVNKQKLDTTTVSTSVQMSLSNGFSVTGDTTTIQAPSHGNYTGYGGGLVFNDATAGGSDINSKKKHLNGVYLYNYDGSRLQMEMQNDTIALLYNISK